MPVVRSLKTAVYNSDNGKRIQMVYQAKDLSPEKRQAAELLLGRAISTNEAVSIKGLSAHSLIPSRLTPAERLAAFDSLSARWGAPNHPVDPQDEAAAVEEALRASRPNYRSVD